MWGGGPFGIGIAWAPSGLVVLDLDRPKPDGVRPAERNRPGIRDGADFLAALAADRGVELPLDTLAVQTGSGAEHLYFGALAGVGIPDSGGRLRLDVLLTSQMHGVELTYPHLVAQGTGGSIAITSSMAALRPMMRTENGRTLGVLGYSAAKAALVNLARNYASILAVHGIRVNTVQPTGVHTPMTQNRMIEDHFADAAHEDTLALNNPIPVDGVEAADISDMMVFLCSDESRYVTGSALPVDAGSTLR